MNIETGMPENLKDSFRRTKVQLAKVFRGPKPLAFLFKTKNQSYVYDAGSNRIFNCSPAEYGLLDGLLKQPVDQALTSARSSLTPEEVQECADNLVKLSEDGIFRAKSVRLGLPRKYAQACHERLTQIILEVTERCNMRCTYCIYSPSFSQKRDHGTKDMTIDTAHQAINYLIKNSVSKDKVAISFYGGEPLLRFPFIQDCVSYAETLIPRAKLSFAMTTNGTLMTPAIAEYLGDHGFGTHVSLDGPEDIHDQHRVFRNGQGSFSAVRKAIKYLITAYGDKAREKITLSMVYSPPFSDEKIRRIASLWGEKWFPKDLFVSFSYRHMDFSPSHRTGRIDWTVLNWAVPEYIEAFRRHRKPHPFARGLLEKKLAIIHQRVLSRHAARQTGLNACCLPGVRKIYVSTSGALSLCERVGNAPDIGNVRSGLDVKRVQREYLSLYRNRSAAECARCWSVQLCDICYAQSYYDGRFDPDFKKIHCRMNMQITELYLKIYCTLFEMDQERLNEILNIQLS